jgi:GTP-binding protein
VAILVIDATEGFANLDATIAGYALDSGCSLIIAVNKWDAIEEKETNTANDFEKELRYKMKFLDWSPIMTISALTGQRVAKILPIVQKANEARNLRIPTGKLNEFFEQTVAQPRVGGGTAPGSGSNVRLHVQFITQAGMRPPLFVVFTSGGPGGKGGLHFSYLRYIENQLREKFDFFATPIRLKEKHKTKKPKK